MADLSVDLGFLKLRNPVLAASGTFGYGLEFSPFLDFRKIGGLVVKGIYFGPREGNPPPRLVETTGGLINAIGLPGVGVERFCEETLPRLREIDTTVFINVCGEDDEEYIRVIERLEREPGIAAYELNISCPNVKKNGVCPALNAQSTYTLVRMAKSAARRPLIAKLSPNVTSITEIAGAAAEGGADGISLINTLLAMAVDVETRKPRLGNILGGLSGPAVKPIALRMVYQTASAVKIPVIGVGGIVTGNDALEYLIVGARAVQVGTASFADPAATERIAAEMEEYCDRTGVRKISDLVGSLKV